MGKGTLNVEKGVVAGMESIDIIDAYNVPDPAVEAMVREIVAQGKREVVFNLKRMTYITSMGVGQLVKIIKMIVKMEGQLYLYGASDDTKELLKDLALDKYLKYL